MPQRTPSAHRRKDSKASIVTAKHFIYPLDVPSCQVQGETHVKGFKININRENWI